MSDFIDFVFNLSGDGMTSRDWLNGLIGCGVFFASVWTICLFAVGMGVA